MEHICGTFGEHLGHDFDTYMHYKQCNEALLVVHSVHFVTKRCSTVCKMQCNPGMHWDSMQCSVIMSIQFSQCIGNTGLHCVQMCIVMQLDVVQCYAAM